MKKYILALGIGALLLGSACDPMNQEALTPVSAEEELLAENDPNGENFRKTFGNAIQVINLTERNYQFMENAYGMLPSFLPKERVDQRMATSRSKEEFVGAMIKKSLDVFDGNLLKNGRFLSPTSKRNHQALAGDEHEIEYDIVAFSDDEEAAFDYYIKIPDIDGESSSAPVEEFSLNFGKIKYRNAAGTCGPKEYACDSTPRINPKQLEETIEFLKQVDRFNGDPAQTSAGLEELKLSAGIDPVPAGLLLPAIQKVREAARINARGKADILIESLSKGYQIDLESQRGKFLKYGGMGSIAELVSENYDDEGDLDWTTIQLNRTKFELEMLLLWTRYWDENHRIPGTGR